MEDISQLDSMFQYFEKYHRLSTEEKSNCRHMWNSSFDKNKELQAIGHTCKTIYFIHKGMARIYYYKDGTDITESFSFENDIIARVESLLPEIRVAKPYRSLRIPKSSPLMQLNCSIFMTTTLELNVCSENLWSRSCRYGQSNRRNSVPHCRGKI